MLLQATKAVADNESALAELQARFLGAVSGFAGEPEHCEVVPLELIRAYDGHPELAASLAQVRRSSCRLQ
jgi:hypothetical protein